MSKRIKNGHIFCLESLWAASTEYPRQSVLPILEIIKMAYVSKISYLSCNTKAEFLYNLSLANKKYGILYLAFHGKSGKLLLPNEDEITIEELGKAMGKNFRGVGVHFASCNVMDEDEEIIKKFIKKTGVSFVSGYTKPVYWLPSCAVDIVYIDYLLDNWTNPELAVEKMKEQIIISDKNLGFRFIS